MIIRLFILTFVLLLPFSSMGEAYNIDDLDILVREKNYDEFFKHFNDLRPSERNDKWKQMVKDMAINFSSTLVAEKNVQKNDFDFIESIFEIPILKNNLSFMLNRADIGVLYFKNCLSSYENYQDKKSNCFPLIEKFWQKSPELEHIGVQLGELVLEVVPENEVLQYYYYFEKAIKTPNMAGLCRKESVQKVILTHFKDYKNKHPLNKSFKEEMKKIASTECLNELTTNLKDLLYTGNDDLVETTYLFLCGLDECHKEEYDLFLLTYLLNGPSVGIIFNSAWNLVSKMGKDHILRKKLFDKLKNIDPLPDKIFKVMDNERREVILDHIFKNFPEYMDYYAETCLKYLEGTKNFENGNPTINCHELFKLTKEKSWVNSALKNAYNNIPLITNEKTRAL